VKREEAYTGSITLVGEERCHQERWREDERGKGRGRVEREIEVEILGF
jgi:hypothetical protein